MRTESISIVTGKYPNVLESESRQTIELLCTTAKKGLMDCYCETGLIEKRCRLNSMPKFLGKAVKLRYIIIAQIGIRRWLRLHGDNELLPDFWEHIHSRSCEINSAGDLGLAIWAGVESNADACKAFAEKLVSNWHRLSKACNAVEIAWVLQAIVQFSQCHPITSRMADFLKDVRQKLMDLYCHNTALFARHNRKNLREMTSRRIACFADQVYPILALANYSRRFKDPMSVEVAAAVADTICRLQGPKGQWWWHYDVNTGIVAEEYPVFSVHQDGMAPMALLAVDRVTGTNHTTYIQKGLMWLNKRNERMETMIMPEQGIIWRDIHRREIHKMYRLARSALITAGLHTVNRLAGRNLFGYIVNRECRLYHLGWILYAWADSKAN
jgi:hypothetical protein